jgi:hypothetical protein
LVAVQLTKRIEIIRSLSGHKHHDLFDRNFERYIKKKNILSPQQLTEELKLYYCKISLHFQVIDLFTIPDYKSMLEPCIDTFFRRYADEVEFIT